MTDTIAFDLDGTLIDSVAHIHHGVASALREMKLPSLTRDETQGFVGRGLPILLQKVLAHIGAPADLHDEFSRRVMHHYVNTPSDPKSIYPDVISALAALRASGYRLTICTNKPGAATETALRDTGLDQYFDIVLSGDSLATRKPEPEMLLAALDGATRSLYVGDSEVDAETAQRASIPFMLYTEGYRKSPVQDLPHKASFSAFADLPGLVERHFSGA